MRNLKPELRMEKRGSIAGAVVTILIYVYLFGATLSVPYFNYRYARDHGFVSWIFFGEVVATFRGLIWPYYALSGSGSPTWTDPERENLEHFHSSIAAVKQVTRILNSAPNDRSFMLSSEESVAIESLYKLALAEATQVDVELLARAHKDLPAHFQNEFLKNLQIRNNAIAMEFPKSEVEFARAMVVQGEAQDAHGKWVDWYNANRKQIHLPKRRSS